MKEKSREIFMTIRYQKMVLNMFVYRKSLLILILEQCFYHQQVFLEERKMPKYVIEVK